MKQVPGNDKVVDALELLLERARSGQYAYLIAMMSSIDDNFGGWFGIHDLETKCMRELAQLHRQMEESIINRGRPPQTRRDWVPPSDLVCFNVPVSPISYDFIAWLMSAEMNRRREGGAFPLKVNFWMGRDGSVGLEHPFRQQMMEKVLRPALKLVGAVEDEAAAKGRERAYFGFRDISDAARRGYEIPRIEADAALRLQYAKFANCVTITLREADHYPFRNSNLKAWLRFAKHLRSQGERVVFVRDTSKATEPLADFDTCPAASIDLDHRTALYSAAKANLFVSNGPATLAFFSDWRFLCFTKPEADGFDYQAQTPAFWREHCGIEIGEQLPWFTREQRIVWASDDYQNLVDAWEQMQAAYRVAAE